MRRKQAKTSGTDPVKRTPSNPDLKKAMKAAVPNFDGKDAEKKVAKNLLVGNAQMSPNKVVRSNGSKQI